MSALSAPASPWAGRAFFNFLGLLGLDRLSLSYISACPLTCPCPALSIHFMKHTIPFSSVILSVEDFVEVDFYGHQFYGFVNVTV
jgi:hypothetical protein